jgi:hypothetical protein
MDLYLWLIFSLRLTMEKYKVGVNAFMPTRSRMCQEKEWHGQPMMPTCMLCSLPLSRAHSDGWWSRGSTPRDKSHMKAAMNTLSQEPWWETRSTPRLNFLHHSRHWGEAGQCGSHGCTSTEWLVRQWQSSISPNNRSISSTVGLGCNVCQTNLPADSSMSLALDRVQNAAAAESSPRPAAAASVTSRPSCW